MLAAHLLSTPMADSASVEAPGTGANRVASARIIVVGSGPVGMHFVKQLLSLHPTVCVSVFGNEPCAPYNRVQLSSLLAGEVTPEQIDIPLPAGNAYPNFSFQVGTITRINRVGKTVIDSLGNEHRYDRLVLATGARAHIPNIPGTGFTGVYRFRSLLDAQAIIARTARCRHVVVMGGGLLGLEAAKALLRNDTKVTVVQQATHLMNRQLDENAAAYLQEELTRLGINVIASSGVREILGHSERVDGVRMHNGTLVSCDTVLLCAGIQPNKELALNARLAVGQGIIVDDQLRTNDPDVFAIGECCEHAGKTYGLVSPGYEQAAVAANIIAGGDAVYKGSIAVARLKVLGQQVSSMGEVVELIRRPGLQEMVWQDKTAGLYRKLVLLRGKIIGVVSYGVWPDITHVQMSFQNGSHIWPWQRVRFSLTGRLWPDDIAQDVGAWPEKTIVCQCKAVNKQSLSAAINKGCLTMEAVQAQTGAGTVCGSCKPLLGEMLGAGNATVREYGWPVLATACVLALLAVLGISVIPAAGYAASVTEVGWFEVLWSDKFWKQVSGFTLLGLTLIGLLLSMRKRLEWRWLGGVAQWRMAHVLLGVGCVGLLMLHTGFHLGENLNRLLMLNFLTILALGAATGMVVALSHRLSALKARKLRKLWTRLHIFVSWPVLALLSAHILTVYYF
jgi:nitrite reductase (NADH) large subunit